MMLLLHLYLYACTCEVYFGNDIMAQKTKLQIRRGLKKDMPSLLEGEPAFATDAGVIYVGSGIKLVEPTNCFVCQGRLALTTDLSSDSDILNAQYLYYVPAIGNEITLYKNGMWINYTFPVLTYDILANCNLANKNYDVFAFYSGVSVILSTVVWTDDTTRATVPISFDGSSILVHPSDHEKRYLGTIRTTATAGRCEFSLVKRFVYNYYNKIACNLFSCPNYNDNNAQTTYTLAVATYGVLSPAIEVVIGYTSFITVNLSYKISATVNTCIGLAWRTQMKVIQKIPYTRVVSVVPLSGGDAVYYPRTNAFDKSGAMWRSSQTGAGVYNTAWIGFSAATAKTILGFRCTQWNGIEGSSIDRVRFQYSDNGTTWTTVGDYTLNMATEEEVIETPNVGSHTYWRLLAYSVGQPIAPACWAVTEAYFYENIIKMINSGVVVPFEITEGWNSFPILAWSGIGTSTVYADMGRLGVTSEDIPMTYIEAMIDM